jgi:hypothetical protein
MYTDSRFVISRCKHLSSCQHCMGVFLGKVSSHLRTCMSSASTAIVHCTKITSVRSVQCYSSNATRCQSGPCGRRIAGDVMIAFVRCRRRHVSRDDREQRRPTDTYEVTDQLSRPPATTSLTIIAASWEEQVRPTSSSFTRVGHRCSKSPSVLTRVQQNAR